MSGRRLQIAARRSLGRRRCHTLGVASAQGNFRWFRADAGRDLRGARHDPELQLQALIEHFAVECDQHLSVGAIVMDRSNHPIDTHASHCAASYVVSQNLPLHPTVYYADSVTSQAVQVADLISGIRRRVLEGDTSLHPIDTSLGALRPDTQDWPLTHTGRRWTNRIALF